MEDKLYWYWLCGKVRLPIKKQKELMDIFIHPKELYKINPAILKEHMTQLEYDRFVHSRDETAIQKGYEALHRENIRFIIQKEATYPNRLRKIYDAPYGIFQKGQPYEEKELSIAIVGSRYPTTYGFEISKKFAKELAQQGVQIVSGLARGVDGTVHREIIDKKGQAVGVLGCGIDLIYPKENFQLFYDMYANQTVISEYPPGSEPLKWHFPERNRIISGLSDGILVTEARARSGSLITADFALEQGRDVFAVPGPIDALTSAGCNRLIRDGAGLVSDAWDILREYQDRFPDKHQPEGARREPETLGYRARQSREAKPVLPSLSLKEEKLELTDDQIALLRVLPEEEPMLVDDLIEQTGIPARRVLSALTVLELEQLIEQHSGKRYTRKVNLFE